LLNSSASSKERSPPANNIFNSWKPFAFEGLLDLAREPLSFAARVEDAVQPQPCGPCANSHHNSMTDLSETIRTLYVASNRCNRIIAQMKKDSQPPPATHSTIRPLKPTSLQHKLPFARIGGANIPIPSFYEVDNPRRFGT
jgi:hypothetical protein